MKHNQVGSFLPEITHHDRPGYASCLESFINFHLLSTSMDLLSEIRAPKEQLEGFGFIEVSPGLYIKRIADNLKFYRDYRGGRPKSYAYHHNRRVDHTQFIEHRKVIKLEHIMNFNPQAKIGEFA